MLVLAVWQRGWLMLALAGVGAAHLALHHSLGEWLGMVVTAQHLATRVGVDVLKDGGNAVDAAVAVGYALAVVYPAAGNLGGGGFMTLHLADGRETFLDFREKAPLAATPDMYLGPDGQVVPGRSTRGHLAVAVPGTVSGLELARSRYGTRPRWHRCGARIRPGPFAFCRGADRQAALAAPRYAEHVPQC